MHSTFPKSTPVRSSYIIIALITSLYKSLWNRENFKCSNCLFWFSISTPLVQLDVWSPWEFQLEVLLHSLRCEWEETLAKNRKYISFQTFIISAEFVERGENFRNFTIWFFFGVDFAQFFFCFFPWVIGEIAIRFPSGSLC